MYEYFRGHPDTCLASLRAVHTQKIQLYLGESEPEEN